MAYVLFTYTQSGVKNGEPKTSGTQFIVPPACDLWLKLNYCFCICTVTPSTVNNTSVPEYSKGSRTPQIWLTLNPLTWKIWWAPNNASRWQVGFNSAFNGLRSTWCSSSSVQGVVCNITSHLGGSWKANIFTDRIETVLLTDTEVQPFQEQRWITYFI